MGATAKQGWQRLYLIEHLSENGLAQFSAKARMILNSIVTQLDITKVQVDSSGECTHVNCAISLLGEELKAECIVLAQNVTHIEGFSNVDERVYSALSMMPRWGEDDVFSALTATRNPAGRLVGAVYGCMIGNEMLIERYFTAVNSTDVRAMADLEEWHSFSIGALRQSIYLLDTVLENVLDRLRDLHMAEVTRQKQEAAPQGVISESLTHANSPQANWLRDLQASPAQKANIKECLDASIATFTNFIADTCQKNGVNEREMALALAGELAGQFAETIAEPQATP